MRLNQRERILDAAEKCFIRFGFHAGSIANIAHTANISQGLIYRYFRNKAAMVQAIIERQLNSEHVQMITRSASGDEVCRSMLQMFESWCPRDDSKWNPVLMLELSAESARDEEVARAVRAEQKIIGRKLSEVIRRSAHARGAKITGPMARSRGAMLQCLVEGLAMRLVRNPALDWETLRPALEEVVALLTGGDEVASGEVRLRCD